PAVHVRCRGRARAGARRRARDLLLDGDPLLVADRPAGAAAPPATPCRLPDPVPSARDRAEHGAGDAARRARARVLPVLRADRGGARHQRGGRSAARGGPHVERGTHVPAPDPSGPLGPRARARRVESPRKEGAMPLSPAAFAEEGGEDTVGGKTTAHAYLFVKLAEALGIARDELFSTEYLPTTIIEKNELFLLQRSSTLEALCGGNIATESVNPIHMQRMADAMEKHYGVDRAALDFYYVHVEVEGDHAERAVRILSKLATTDAEQARGRLAMRRALTARRICADGMLEAFVGPAGR